jgi:hypothetical protein
MVAVEGIWEEYPCSFADAGCRDSPVWGLITCIPPAAWIWVSKTAGWRVVPGINAPPVGCDETVRVDGIETISLWVAVGLITKVAAPSTIALVANR